MSSQKDSFTQGERHPTRSVFLQHNPVRNSKSCSWNDGNRRQELNACPARLLPESKDHFPPRRGYLVYHYSAFSPSRVTTPASMFSTRYQCFMDHVFNRLVVKFKPLSSPPKKPPPQWNTYISLRSSSACALGSGNVPSSSPVKNTVSNSSPFEAWRVIS